MKYLIWSFEHGAWWASHRSGYTSDIRIAGRYTAEEAIEIMCRCEVGNEIPVREDKAGPEIWPATTVRSLRYPSMQQTEEQEPYEHR